MVQNHDDVQVSSPWVPSRWAQLLGRADDWDAQLDGLNLIVRHGGGTVRFSVGEINGVAESRGAIWSAVVISRHPTPVMLSGMNRRSAADIQNTLALANAEKARLDRLAAQFTWAATEIERWWGSVREGLREHTYRWIPLETAGQWAAARPQLDPRYLDARHEPALATFCASQPPSVLEAIAAWEADDVASMVQDVNVKFLADEREQLREFFDMIESSPLTDEQVESVVAFDNRVRVIAAAGSGKTSTMIARAGYAIHRQIAAPEEILLLAFNKKAAAELAERAAKRLGPAGSRLAAQTFHSFGLSVIGGATGTTPSLAEDVLKDEGLSRLRRVVDELREGDSQFRRSWDLFRLVYAGHTERAEDRAAREADELVTLAGEKVKSQEELLIANWLFYNGVEYEYERSYEYDTADAEHRQYAPDFYYPSLGIYHEHWAINHRGESPFKGYHDGMAWKRNLHAERGTTLIETTSASIRDGSGLKHLAAELTSRGIELDENPDRRPKGPEPLKDADMLRLVRAFLVHAKNNRTEVDQLHHKYSIVQIRTRLFLHVAAKAQRGWEASLAREGAIDFEDMLNRATDLIDAGRWRSPYKVVMVDELQDTSVARARLIQGLTREPGTFLYGVGDDWQSINRFAGADLSVMSDFENWFGPGPTVRLQRTFRSCQAICDVAGSFVMKNDTQLAKDVVSSQPGDSPAVRALLVKSKKEYPSAIESCLTELNDQAARREAGPASVFVLGRYRRDADLLKEIQLRRFTNLKIEFSTVHSAKGREAEYVILPGMTARDFPSAMTDDPLLELVMPKADTYPHAEERRLFYVALTRARRAVIMLASKGAISPFLRELIRDDQVSVRSLGESLVKRACPECGSPLMASRKGPHSNFLGCLNFPGCQGTVNITPRPRRAPVRTSPRPAGNSRRRY